MRISVNFAAVPDMTPERASWLAHSHHLRAFALLAGFHRNPVGGTHRVLVDVATEAADFPVPAVTAGTWPAVGGCLNRAWGTELAMCAGRQYAAEDELLRVMNSWAAVQSYYVAYHVAQALIVAEGGTRPTTHPATQKQYVDLWVARAARLNPWTFAVGSQQDRRCAPDGMADGPGRPLTNVHAWHAATPANAWEHAEQALRSTRGAAYDERCAKARQEKARERQKEWTEQWAHQPNRRKPDWWTRRPNLDAATKARIEKGTRPYTLLDYLYRLRVKANYEDARVYTSGPANQGEAQALNDDLALLASATAIVHEVRIAQLVGAKTFLHEAEQWAARNAPTETNFGLPARLKVLRSVL